MAIEPWVNAAELKKARVTQIIKDVKLLSGRAAPRPATVSEDVGQGTAVRTGVESRAELTFTDLTITRLGANTIFSFNEATRELNLGSGAILVEVPKNAPAIQIVTPAFTGGVTGGTAILEFHPGAPGKFLILEGTGELCPKGNPSGCVTVHAGEMVMTTPEGQISQPVQFDVSKLYQTSLLITDFPPLPNADLILQVIDQQQQALNGPANPSPTPTSAIAIDVLSQRAAASPSPTASPQIGPPVIRSPVPYVINNGTTIVTHPTITTNGVTDHGVIYHGSAVDGPVSTFAFGSTSAFDRTSGFNKVVQGKNKAAAFKFASLQLAGNPTIDTTNGPIRLGLIAVSGITSGGEGSNITFTGLRGVLLAAQDGSVNLGSEIAFSGFHDLNIYARGPSSDLTLGSDVSTEHLALFAERDMSITSNITTGELFAVAGRDMQVTGNSETQGNVTVANDATFTILGSNGAKAGAAININGATYNIGGAFLATLSDGAITLSNASIAADVVKVGALGSNGKLTIGGSSISANTLLKLYAPGSNGTLNFVANVTLSSGTAANLAAKTITIQPSVVVNIAGDGGPANIFTSNPNYNFTPGPSYTGPPGNSSNGSFGGNRALDPQPLANAPSFTDPPASSSSSTANAGVQTLSSANVASSGKINGGLGGARQKGGEPAPNGKATGATINVGSSAQLLSMLDAATPGPGGKITIPASKSTGSPGNSSRNKVRGRWKADRRAADTRRTRDRRVIKLTADAFDTGANNPQPPASAPPLDQGSSLTRRGGSQ